MDTPISATLLEGARREEVLARVVEFIRRNRPILLPGFDGRTMEADFALQSLPENDFSGVVGDYRYQFEGEDDLLHVMIGRQDAGPLEVIEAQRVVAFLAPQVSPGVIWLKPGRYSHHFYLGHDELLEGL